MLKSGYSALAEAFARLLEAILDALKKRQRDEESSKEQQARNNLERDPAGWFSDHFDGGFGGVHDDATAASAAEADKTEAGSHPPN